MVKLLKNQTIQLGAGGILVFALGVVVSLLVVGLGSPGGSTDDHVSLTSGGAVRADTEEPGAFRTPPSNLLVEALPLTAAEAVAAGWEDPVLCDPGRGRYFRKGKWDEGPPYFLMYNSENKLIGVYMFVVSESEMPPPWRMWDELRAGGIPIIDQEHWSLLVNFRDPTRACKTLTRSRGESGWSGEGGVGARSTPTPYVAPTPTPAAGALLKLAADRMASLKALRFTLTGEPEGALLMAGAEAARVQGTLGPPDQITLEATDAEGTVEEVLPDSLPFGFVDLGATIADVARALKEPVDIEGRWIDNLKHRGVSGSVTAQDLRGLFTSAVPGASVIVQMWVSDDNLVRRVRIEGPVAPDDSPGVVRVLDLEGFD